MNLRYGRGSAFIENLKANFNTRTVLSGHSDCFENLIVNCGVASASFAFLVIALGLLVFGIYAIREHRQSSALRGEQEAEKVFVDKEGWETKAVDEEEGSETRTSDDEEGWETKAED
jgi:hypothetical protein